MSYFRSIECQLDILFLCRFDEKQNSSSKKLSLLNNNNSRSGSKQTIAPTLLKTAQVRFGIEVFGNQLNFDLLQFGVTLKFINDNSPCLNYIPPVVRMCVDHLALSDSKLCDTLETHVLIQLS